MSAWRVAWRGAPRSRSRLTLFHSRTIQTDQPDEKSICLRVHRSKDASAECEAVFLDVYVSRSALAENGDGTVEPVPDALKRKLQFRGVRVLELHDEHGCHFHVITNQRFPIRKILAFGQRYGFGRMDVRSVPDVERAIRYLCKYLSKSRPGCLKRARLWSAFGRIERTRVKDVLSDTPLIRILRRVMGKASIEDELNGIDAAPIDSSRFRPERNFRRAVEKANAVYLLGFDPEHFERQEMWAKCRYAGVVDLSHPWSAGNPLLDER